MQQSIGRARFPATIVGIIGGDPSDETFTGSNWRWHGHRGLRKVLENVVYNVYFSTQPGKLVCAVSDTDANSGAIYHQKTFEIPVDFTAVDYAGAHEVAGQVKNMLDQLTDAWENEE
jgi:hypothetical protein